MIANRVFDMFDSNDSLLILRTALSSSFKNCQNTITKTLILSTFLYQNLKTGYKNQPLDHLNSPLVSIFVEKVCY